MADNKVVVELFKKDDSVGDLIRSAQETDPESLFMVGLKDGTIYYGSSNYPSTMYALGCIEIIREHLVRSSYEDGADNANL